MSKRDRLGKGLGALLGEYLGEDDDETGALSRPLPIARIRPNPFQPRREFDEDELAELATSIRENGLLQPIVVRPAEGDEEAWELVAGERRWRAVTRLGWKNVPAIVRAVDDRTLLVLALVENLQRASLSPLEEAEGYKQLAEEFDLSQKEIAETVGRDRSTVANSIRLLQLPATVRRLVDAGDLSAGHARALLAIEGDRRLSELARQAAEEGWSVRETEARVKRTVTKQKPKKKTRRTRDPVERELEEALRRALGTQVKIHRGRGNRGRVEIPFYSSEDFERIFELLVGDSVVEYVS